MMMAVWFGVILLWSIAIVLCVMAGLTHQIRRSRRLQKLLQGHPGPMGQMGQMGEDIWVESERKGYTDLNKDEWLERLNALIHQGDSRDVDTRE